MSEYENLAARLTDLGRFPGDYRSQERGQALHGAAALIRRLAAENERLRADLEKTCPSVSSCEACGAPLLDGDDYVSDPDGVNGCWHAMTDVRPDRERPCYAYRIGKPDARAALESRG